MRRSKTIGGSEVHKDGKNSSVPQYLSTKISDNSNDATNRDLRAKFSIENVKIVDGESPSEGSSDSNVTAQLIEKSSNHSRYCCDNIPVA